MPQIEYLVRARARNGRLVEQLIRGSSETDAIARIRQLGLTPIAVEAKAGGWNRDINLRKPKVKGKDLAVMTRQFATMLGAGLPILRCLAILAEQSESQRLREVLLRVRDDVERGAALSESLAEYEEFPPIMVNMIRAGEVGGFLDETMLQIAESIEADVRLRGRIKAALTYPVAVGVIAVIVTTAMLIFVVPVFSEMFNNLGGQLPAPTQFLVNLSNLVKNPYFLFPIILGSILLVWWYHHVSREPWLRAIVDPMKFRLPVFGHLFQKIALARFSRNFAALLRAGVPILVALDIVGDTAGNIVIRRAVDDVKESVRQGSSIAKPLAEHGVFPDMVVQMMAVGEDTGALDHMLGKIADFYDEEVESTTEQLMALIEPIMIMMLGALVGGMIVAMYLPIFNIFDLVKK
ncbi:MAG: type II secretion system F family protein [Actinomycetota bacterium]|nr:type II secretion system F family protein [Actinomycetota bacterium]